MLQPFPAIFFAICKFIFHKTEVQTVILRCFTGINSDWFKSYDTKRNFHFPLFASEAITFEPIKIYTCSTSQNDRLNLSFVRDKHTYGKKIAIKGPTTVVYQCLSFPIRVYFLVCLLVLKILQGVPESQYAEARCYPKKKMAGF